MAKLFGSFENRIIEFAKPIPPEIGMGTTRISYSDRDAYTIVEIKNKSCIVVQRDHAVRTDSNGQSDSQSYIYAKNPLGEKRVFSKRKDGRWKESKGCCYLVIGERNAYHDYSF